MNNQDVVKKYENIKCKYMSEKVFRGITFENCDDVAFAEVSFENCTFNKCFRLSFNDCKIKSCKFENSEIYRLDWSNVNDCNFGETEINRIIHSNISTSDFYFCYKIGIIKNSSIDSMCNFINCSFMSCYITMSTLDGNYIDCDFRDAQINCNLDAINLGIHSICPEEGSFIAWKKARLDDKSYCIIKLKIPKDAKRLSGTSRKCRCNKAKVLEIQALDNPFIAYVEAHSWYNSAFTYKAGKTVKATHFDDNRWVQCGEGIHFFMTRREAEVYEF